MLRRILIAAVAAATASSTLAATVAGDSQAVMRGLLLARRNCAQCHSIGAKGGSPNAEAPPFRSLHMRYPADSLDEAFQKGLLYRHPSMPQFRFLPGEIADLTSYMRSLRAQSPREASAKRARRGGTA